MQEDADKEIRDALSELLVETFLGDFPQYRGNNKALKYFRERANLYDTPTLIKLVAASCGRTEAQREQVKKLVERDLEKSASNWTFNA